MFQFSLLVASERIALNSDFEKMPLFFLFIWNENLDKGLRTYMLEAAL